MAGQGQFTIDLMFYKRYMSRLLSCGTWRHVEEPYGVPFIVKLPNQTLLMNAARYEFWFNHLLAGGMVFAWSVGVQFGHVSMCFLMLLLSF